MNHLRRYLSLSAIPLLLLLTFSATAFAQAYDPNAKMEPTYEVSLQVIIGSNEAGGGKELPSNLNTISKQLKSNFSFSNYRLANTILGRVANNGTLEYKSVTNILGQESDAEAQTFLEWTMGNFRSYQNGFQARPFRFGAKVPVKVGSTKDDSGRVTPLINYEAIGLTVGLVGLPLNTPTLIGTVSLPKTTGTIFLVATIKQADM